MHDPEYVQFDGEDWLPVDEDDLPALTSVEKVDANFTTTTTPTAVDIGVSATYTVTDRPIVVEFGCVELSHSATGAIVLVQLVEDATVLNFIRGSTAAANQRLPIGTQSAKLDTPGDHTVKLQAINGATGTMTIICNATAPIYMRARYLNELL